MKIKRILAGCAAVSTIFMFAACGTADGESTDGSVDNSVSNSVGANVDGSDDATTDAEADTSTESKSTFPGHEDLPDDALECKPVGDDSTYDENTEEIYNILQSVRDAIDGTEALHMIMDMNVITTTKINDDVELFDVAANMDFIMTMTGGHAMMNIRMDGEYAEYEQYIDIGEDVTHVYTNEMGSWEYYDDDGYQSMISSVVTQLDVQQSTLQQAMLETSDDKYIITLPITALIEQNAGADEMLTDNFGVTADMDISSGDIVYVIDMATNRPVSISMKDVTVNMVDIEGEDIDGDDVADSYSADMNIAYELSFIDWNMDDTSAAEIPDDVKNSATPRKVIWRILEDQPLSAM